jgi:DNA repair protein RecO (recombination protein O)
VYTRDYGKISASCKGSKKLQSKLAPFLENHDVLNLFLVQGRSRMYIIGIDYVERFPALLQDYKKMIYVAYCLEVVERLTRNHDPDVGIFQLLHTVLALIEEYDQAYDILMHGFTLKMLVALGFTPQVFTCVRCEKELNVNGNIFSFAEGGCICPVCQRTHPTHGVDIDANTIKLLRVGIQDELGVLLHLGMKYEIRSQFAHIIQKYLYYHTDRTLRTLKLLAHA